MTVLSGSILGDRISTEFETFVRRPLTLSAIPLIAEYIPRTMMTIEKRI